MIVWSGIILFLLLAARLWGLDALGTWLSPALKLELGHAILVAAVVAVTLFIDGLVRHYYWHRYLQKRRNRETPALIQDILTIALCAVLCGANTWEQIALHGRAKQAWFRRFLSLPNGIP